MQFKRGAKILTSMEPLALTDIIINMFIFFFITFSFLATFQKIREGQVDVSLPKAASAQPPAEKKTPERELEERWATLLRRDADDYCRTRSPL